VGRPDCRDAPEREEGSERGGEQPGDPADQGVRRTRRHPGDDYNVIDLLDRLADRCVELLAADAAGIRLADAQRNLRVVASANE
jgi:hypothetical protein